MNFLLYLVCAIRSKYRLDNEDKSFSIFEHGQDSYCFGYTYDEQPYFKQQVDIDIIEAMDEQLLEEDDEYIFYPVEVTWEGEKSQQAFTMYKRVDKKIKPVSTTFSPDYEV
jgi:hypothetical protein